VLPSLDFSKREDLFEFVRGYSSKCSNSSIEKYIVYPFSMISEYIDTVNKFKKAPS
jgi:hypothetical protein